MLWRSKDILSYPKNSGTRVLFKSMGYTDYDLERPLIGVANAWNTLVPGHSNLRQVASAVKTGISQAGGTPVEFGVIGACDGIAAGNNGMHYILPTREIIANSIELMVEAHTLDAIVLLGSCDKIVPGMLMAAARLDIPAIVVPGGNMLGGAEFDGRSADTTSLGEAYGMLKVGKITEEEYMGLENKVCTTCGSCSFLGTANTMCCVAEAMGMTVPYGGTEPAAYAGRLHLAQESGRAIMKLLEKGISAKKIITKESLLNAIRVSMAIGGSTNSVLHILAIAYEAGVDISIETFDEMSRSTPHVAKIYPAAAANVPDFHLAGGVPAVMKELVDLLDTTVLTANGKTLGENIANAKVTSNREIIKTVEEPFAKDGGLAVLHGNLAPGSAVSKPAAIDPSMWLFKGKAKVFDSEDECNAAIDAGEIKEGDVMVIRYEGPKGGPGMREMSTGLKRLYGLGLALKTALITDGRFSGTNNGCFVGHISPEAAEGGPIAAVRDGDMITIDIPNRALTLHVDDEEIEKRLSTWERPAPKIKRGYLNIYSKLAESANHGAIIRHD